MRRILTPEELHDALEAEKSIKVCDLAQECAVTKNAVVYGEFDDLQGIMTSYDVVEGEESKDAPVQPYDVVNEGGV